MQNPTAMNADIKALLTVLLLKTGTTPKEIQTVLMVASTSRVMIAAEYAASRTENPVETTTGNVSSIGRAASSDVPANPAEFDPETDGVYSDIKALLSMVLLQNGVSTNEIQTTLRVAAASRRAMAEQREESADQEEDIPQKPASRTPERRQATATQTLRSDRLSPISIKDLQRSAPLRRTA